MEICLTNNGFWYSTCFNKTEYNINVRDDADKDGTGSRHFYVDLKRYWMVSQLFILSFFSFVMKRVGTSS